MGCCCDGKDDRDEDDIAELMVVFLLLCSMDGDGNSKPIIKQIATRKWIGVRITEIRLLSRGNYICIASDYYRLPT